MRRIYYWLFIILLATYIVLSFTLPVDPQVLARYKFNTTDVRLLNLSIILPISAIYLSALFAFLRVKDYAHDIRKTKEGPHLQYIANGLMVLAFSLPVTSVIGSLFSYVRHSNQGLLPLLTVLRSYVGLVFAGVALMLIAKGAEGLYSGIKNKGKMLSPTTAILGPTILASLFTWLITANEPSTNGHRAYYLPEWLIITTIAIPYTYFWCLGIRGAFHLNRYQTDVKGIIYKQAFDNLSKGIGVVIGILVITQFIVAISEKLTRLNLTPLLLIIYVLLMLYSVGFGLVARGSKKLKKIEEA